MNSDDWYVRYRDARVDSGSLWSATPPKIIRNNVQSTLTVTRCEMLHRNPTDDPESADDTRLSVDTILIAYSPLSIISSRSQPS